MKAIILYATHHGCAEKCAAKLGEQLMGEIEIKNFKTSSKISLDDYETVVLGGSIHAGKIQQIVKRFCLKNLETLKSKRLGLFLCCMEEEEKAEEQFASSFPKELIRSAAARGLFGGEFDFDRMNWLERAIIKKIAKIDSNISNIQEQNIREFARILNESAGV